MQTRRTLSYSVSCAGALEAPPTTQKDPERLATLYDGVVGKISDQLPDETWVYPGHGKDTTVGDERPHLAEWKARGW